MDHIEALADAYKWAHDFWRRMGWRELHLWIAARDRSLQRAAQAHVADPGSWDGRQSDQWWAEQDRKRGR